MSIPQGGCWPLLSLSLVACLVGCGGRGSDGDPPAEEGAVKETARRLPDIPHIALAFSPDGKTLAASGYHSLHLYDIASGQELATAKVESEGVTAGLYLAFSPDGKHLASAHMSNLIDHPALTLYLWEITGEGRLHRAHTLFEQKPQGGARLTTVFHVSFSPDGKTVVSGSADGTVYLWDTITGKERVRFPGGTVASFAADGKTVIAVSHDGAVSCWDAATGKVVRPAPQTGRRDFIHVGQAAFAPSGTVAVLEGSMVSLREVATDRQVCRLTFPWGVSCPALSPDGRVLALSAGGGIWFFDGITGQERGWRKGQGDIVFSPDGRYIAYQEDEVVVVRELSEVLANLGKPPAPALSKPPGMPLEAELIVKQDSHALDLGDRTPEEFSRHILNDPFPPRPQVNAIFRLRNTGDQKLTMTVYGKPGLFLTGEGAINLSYLTQTGVIGPGPDRVTLKPGETHDFPVKCVEDDRDGVSYWLLPGEYSLHAVYSATISPAPKGAKADEDGSVWVLVRSPPVKVKVVAARK